MKMLSPIEQAGMGRTSAEPYGAKTFTAFRIPEGGKTYPIKIEASSGWLSDALNAAVVRCFHKDTLAVREVCEDTGSDKLYLYSIKRKSRPNYVYRDYEYHREHDLYPQPVCVIDAGVLVGDPA